MTKLALSEITWGPTDANDQPAAFLKRFVAPAPIQQLFLPKYWLISGEKGSGKSAVRQALLQKYASDFVAVIDISFDGLEFNEIVRELAELSSITNIEGLTLMTNYWRYCLIIEAMKGFIERKQTDLTPEFRKLKSFLTRNANGQGDILFTMLTTIEKAWSFIDVKTTPGSANSQKQSTLPSNLTAKVIDSIRRYPNEQASFVKMLDLFSNLLEKSNRKLLIILDGFDRIKNTAAIRTGVNLIFEGLATAVYGISIDGQFGHLFQIKALIPNDRYISMDLRDLDKLDAKHKSIRWNYISLKEFLAKRMALHPRLEHQSHFDNLWPTILPDYVTNPYYKIDEHSYDYILRHTMYRPRHLQIHLEKLASLYPDKIVDHAMIPKSVNESSKKIANFYFKEYALDHPHLEELLTTQFRSRENVLLFRVFRDIIHRSLNYFGVTDVTVDQKLDVLYSIGFFGVIRDMTGVEKAIQGDRYFPPRKVGVKPYKVDFHYTAANLRITHSLRDETLVALHPIFVDLAQVDPHPDFIIG